MVLASTVLHPATLMFWHLPAGVSGDVLLSWHAPSRRVLAVGVGGKVLLVSVPADGGMEQLEFDLDDNSTPGGR